MFVPVRETLTLNIDVLEDFHFAQVADMIPILRSGDVV